MVEDEYTFTVNCYDGGKLHFKKDSNTGTISVSATKPFWGKYENNVDFSQTELKNLIRALICFKNTEIQELGDEMIEFERKFKAYKEYRLTQLSIIETSVSQELWKIRSLIDYYSKEE